MRYPKGVEVRDLKSGTVYLRMPHYADKDKDAAWVAEVQLQMSDVPLVFRREILMDETVATGQPIYSNYDDDLHVHRDRDGNEAYIPIFPGCLYWGGLDGGQALQPAFTLYQMLPRPFQIHAICETVSEGGEPMEIFAPRVMRDIMAVLPMSWDTVQIYADHTITARDGTKGGTAQDEARKHGLILTPETNVWAPRLGAAIWLFNRRLDLGPAGFKEDGKGGLVVSEKPGFKLDALRCPRLREACQGKYKYRVSKQGDPDGPGAVIIEPLKNGWSHVAESLQYAAMQMRKLIAGDDRAQITNYAR